MPSVTFEGVRADLVLFMRGIALSVGAGECKGRLQDVGKRVGDRVMSRARAGVLVGERIDKATLSR
jgi:hypothetical protein